MKPKIEQIIEKSIELALSSSFIGLPNIFRTDKIFLRIMWIFLFLISSGATIYTILKAVNNYLAYDKITNIYVFNQKQAEFPAVTFFILRNSKFNVSLNDILRSCQFNSIPCGPNDFDKLQDKHGYISFRSRNKIAFAPGSFFGFKVEMNLQNIPIDFDSRLNGVGGLRIMIHNISNDPGNYGGMPLTGFDLAPGFINEIKIKRTFTHKLGEPFNNCLKDIKSIDSHDSDLFRYMIQSTNYLYRQADCFNYCMGRELYKYMNISNKIDHYSNVLNENPLKFDEYMQFYLNILINNNTNQFCGEQECPEECDSVKYETTHTFTRSFDMTDNDIFFNIFYPTLEYTVIDQIPKMDLFDFISNIGGNLSLFIGISFLSLIEFIELFIEIIVIIFNRKIIFTL
jgi:hypothetical protein